MATRGERLNVRFKAISEAVAHLTSDDQAFAAASAAWLQAMRYGQRESMAQILRFVTDPVAKAAAKERLEQLDEHNEAILRGYHAELCEHLGVDPAQALRLSKHFEQVVRDICFQGG